MKLIRNIEALPAACPEYHHNLQVRTIMAPASGAGVIQASLVSLEVNGRADAHIHEDQEHLFIVLTGELTARAPDGEEIIVKAGDAYHVPAGESHENYNSFGKETRYIVVTCRVPK